MPPANSEECRWFNQTEANLVTDYRSQITDSNAVEETIAAPYLRLDSKLFDGRLQLVGGVRYERTEDKGSGPLIDTARTYQRDPSGRIVRDAAGRPVVTAPLATLAGTKLAYVERGSQANRTYDGFFPSFTATCLIRPNLVARATYGRSINRPEFTDIFPTANLPDPTSTNRTITLSNPSLQPWTADSYGVALEYYFNEPSTGVLSTRLYRRDISNFWGSTLTPATDALLRSDMDR